MQARNHLPSRSVLVRNLLASWSGLVAEVLVAFFLTPFIISQLGTSAYGVWSLANGVIGYLGLIDLGVRGSLGRFINQYLARDDDRGVNEVISTSFVFLTGSALVVVCVVLLLGANFSTVFPKTPGELSAQMLLVLPLLAVGLWIAFIGAIYRNVLSAFDRFDLLNGIGLIGLVLRAGLVVVMLKTGGGLPGLVAAVTISAAIVCVLALVAASRIYPELSVTWRNFSRARLREMWRFGLVAFATRGSSEIIYQSDQVILMSFLGPHAVAIYGVANMLVLYAQRIVEQLGAVFNPALMKSGSVGDMPSLRKAYVLYPRAAYFVAIPLYVGFAVFGGDFIKLWVGPEFKDAVSVLTILAVAELASLLTGLGGSLLFGLGRLRFNLYCSMSEAGLNVLVTVVLITQTELGVVGAALGTMIAAVLFRGLFHPLYTCRTLALPFRRYFTDIGWRIVIAAGFAFVTFNGVRLLVKPGGWLAFLMAVVTCSVLFTVFGALIMLGRGESVQVLRAMPLLRGKGK